MGSEFVNSPDEQCLLGDKDCDRFLLEQSQKRALHPVSPIPIPPPPLMYRLTLGCRKYTRGSYQYCARASGIDN